MAITRPVTQRVECISCVVAKEVAPKITVSDALTETVKVSDGERVHLGEGSRVLLIPEASFECLAYVHDARGREHHPAKAHVKDGKCITAKLIHLRVNEMEPRILS